MKLEDLRFKKKIHIKKEEKCVGVIQAESEFFFLVGRIRIRSFSDRSQNSGFEIMVTVLDGFPKHWHVCELKQVVS